MGRKGIRYRGSRTNIRLSEVCVLSGIYICAFITSNGLTLVNKVKDDILKYAIVRLYNKLITVDYIGISLDCFWRKDLAADNVFASLRSLYVFQMRCALTNPCGSFLLLGSGSSFRQFSSETRVLFGK